MLLVDFIESAPLINVGQEHGAFDHVLDGEPAT
jgi:hypothetical protein